MHALYLLKVNINVQAWFYLCFSRSGRSRSLADPEGGLPTVEAFQRHELTLLRIEDTLNHDWGSASGKSGQ